MPRITKGRDTHISCTAALCGGGLRVRHSICITHHALPWPSFPRAPFRAAPLNANMVQQPSEKVKNSSTRHHQTLAHPSWRPMGQEKSPALRKLAKDDRLVEPAAFAACARNMFASSNPVQSKKNVRKTSEYVLIFSRPLWTCCSGLVVSCCFNRSSYFLFLKHLEKNETKNLTCPPVRNHGTWISPTTGGLVRREHHPTWRFSSCP